MRRLKTFHLQLCDVRSMGEKNTLEFFREALFQGKV